MQYSMNIVYTYVCSDAISFNKLRNNSVYRYGFSYLSDMYCSDERSLV